MVGPSPLCSGEGHAGPLDTYPHSAIVEVGREERGRDEDTSPEGSGLDAAAAGKESSRLRRH